MTLIEKRLRAMLRGRLPEAEREELEAWYLQSDQSDEPVVVERLENVEREVLASWRVGELAPTEATSVLKWQAAHYCRLLATRVALRQKALKVRLAEEPASSWVM